MTNDDHDEEEEEDDNSNDHNDNIANNDNNLTGDLMMLYSHTTKFRKFGWAFKIPAQHIEHDHLSMEAGSWKNS